MPKTITIRLEDSIYDIFKKAADGEKRSISNYIEYATLTYLTDDIYVSNEEMEEIKHLTTSLRKGLKDAKEGRYTIVK
ncbi:MAG: CopG family transcriptional regulator [Candidatus Firestonebacteria bacterium]